MLREQLVDVVHHGVALDALVVAQDEDEVQPLRRRPGLVTPGLAPAGAARSAAVATTAANVTAVAALPPM